MGFSIIKIFEGPVFMEATVYWDYDGVIEPLYSFTCMYEIPHARQSVIS